MKFVSRILQLLPVCYPNSVLVWTFILAETEMQRFLECKSVSCVRTALIIIRRDFLPRQEQGCKRWSARSTSLHYKASSCCTGITKGPYSTSEDVTQPEPVVLPLLLWLLECKTERRFLYGNISCSSHGIIRWQSMLEFFFRMTKIILNLGLVKTFQASDKKLCLTTDDGIFTGTDTQADSASNSPQWNCITAQEFYGSSTCCPFRLLGGGFQKSQEH